MRVPLVHKETKGGFQICLDMFRSSMRRPPRELDHSLPQPWKARKLRSSDAEKLDNEP